MGGKIVYKFETEKYRAMREKQYYVIAGNAMDLIVVGLD